MCDSLSPAVLQFKADETIHHDQAGGGCGHRGLEGRSGRLRTPGAPCLELPREAQRKPGLLSPWAGVLLTLATAIETDLKRFYEEKHQRAGVTTWKSRHYSLLC